MIIDKVDKKEYNIRLSNFDDALPSLAELFLSTETWELNEEKTMYQEEKLGNFYRLGLFSEHARDVANHYGQKPTGKKAAQFYAESRQPKPAAAVLQPLAPMSLARAESIVGGSIKVADPRVMEQAKEIVNASKMKKSIVASAPETDAPQPAVVANASPQPRPMSVGVAMLLEVGYQCVSAAFKSVEDGQGKTRLVTVATFVKEGLTKTREVCFDALPPEIQAEVKRARGNDTPATTPLTVDERRHEFAQQNVKPTAGKFASANFGKTARQKAARAEADRKLQEKQRADRLEEDHLAAEKKAREAAEGEPRKQPKSKNSSKKK